MIMPISEPIIGNDGNLMKEILVPAGTEIVIGIRPINKDKAIWGEDAEEFKPERWLSPLPSSVTDARIPGVYANLWVFVFWLVGSENGNEADCVCRMTFNGGGRACM